MKVLTTHANTLQQLRAAGITPTVARIGILQAFEASKNSALTVDEVILHLIQRGTPLSSSTVYRAIRTLLDRGFLLREWNGTRRVAYYIKPVQSNELSMRITLVATGESFPIEDDELAIRILSHLRLHDLSSSCRRKA